MLNNLWIEKGWFSLMPTFFHRYFEILSKFLATSHYPDAENTLLADEVRSRHHFELRNAHFWRRGPFSSPL